MDVSSRLWMHSSVSNRFLKVKSHQEMSTEARLWAANMAFTSHHLDWLEPPLPFTTASSLLSGLSTFAVAYYHLLSTLPRSPFSAWKTLHDLVSLTSLSPLPFCFPSPSYLTLLFLKTVGIFLLQTPYFFSPKHFHGFISHFLQVFVGEEYVLIYKITMKYTYQNYKD